VPSGSWTVVSVSGVMLVAGSVVAMKWLEQPLSSIAVVVSMVGLDDGWAKVVLVVVE
jgi:hypothetical protein